MLTISLTDCDSLAYKKINHVGGVKNVILNPNKEYEYTHLPLLQCCLLSEESNDHKHQKAI